MTEVTEVETAFVGGGIMGLSIAYHLAALGHANTAVLEASYLAFGASGRNGGGIRQQWSTDLSIELTKESIERCRTFAQRLGINIWLRQGGYLFLARTKTQVDRLSRSVKKQKAAGLDARLEGARYAESVVPGLNADGVLACSHNPSDGIIFPWPFVWGYARKYEEMGGTLHTHCPVTAIERNNDCFELTTAKGMVKAKRIICTAGAWSPNIGALLGLSIPTHPVRHQICSSEPLKPCLEPLVSDLSTGSYFSQSMRGEIVGGCTVPDEPHTTETASNLRFMVKYSSTLTRLMPQFSTLKVIRQWAGPYDHSPDGNPLLGEHPECRGFFLCNGFVGHGFMMAPTVGARYAEYLAGRDKHPMFDLFSLRRFSNQQAIDIEDFNIG